MNSLVKHNKMQYSKLGVLSSITIFLAITFYLNKANAQQVPDAQIQEWVQLIKRGEINHTERVYTF